MQKILIAVALVLYVLQIEAQPMNTIDSIRINGLKNQLPKLQGTKKVECLNDIAREYVYLQSCLGEK